MDVTKRDVDVSDAADLLVKPIWKRGKPRMFSDRVREWSSLNSGKVTLYAGLALYRTGTAISDDPGWKKKSTNLKEQVQVLRNSGWAGYTLFSAQDLARDTAQAELSGLRTLLERTEYRKAEACRAKAFCSAGKKRAVLKWKKIAGASGYQIYRADKAKEALNGFPR